MLSVLLTPSTNALSRKRISGTGGVVSGGGTIFKLKEFCPNVDFNGSLSPWGFYDTSEEQVENPAGNAQLSYSEAKTGISSASVTFGSSVEWFAVNIGGTTTAGAEISEKTIRLSTYIKTASSSLAFIVYVKDKTTQTQAITSTSNQWATRSANFTMPVLADNHRIFVGIFSTDGTGSAFIDGFSVTCDDVVSDIPSHSFITFSPGFVDNNLINEQNLSRHLVFFETGQNANLLSRIQSLAVDNGVIIRIDLLDALPYQVASGTLISILSPSTPYSEYKEYQIGAYVVECSVSTSIESGYLSADLTVIKNPVLPFNADVSLWRITIYNEYTELFDGVVTSFSDQGNNMRITANGFSYFLGKIKYSGYFESNPDVTIQTVFRDILSNVPQIAYYDYRLDRSGEIIANHTAAGGIGPLDFSDGNSTCKEAIDRVLKLGAFDDTFDSLFLQIYSGAVPKLIRAPRVIPVNRVDFVINASEVGDSRISWSRDMSEFSSVKYGVFSTNAGGQADTLFVGHVNDIVRYGLLEKQVSNGQLSESEFYLVLRNAAMQNHITGNIGDITISCMIQSGIAGSKVHVSLVKSGNIIMLSGGDKNGFGAYLNRVNASYLVVGQTRYDCINGTMQITPFEAESTVEAMINMLEVE